MAKRQKCVSRCQNLESQNSILSTRQREEMTDVEENARLCTEETICGGVVRGARCMCLPQVLQVHQVIFI